MLSPSSSSAADDQRRRQLAAVSPPPALVIPEATLAESAMDVNEFSLSTGDKRKREGKLRSRVWLHFTKLMKEDGTCEKCKCNHCLRLFTCSSRSGTTHLLRHITEGICPAYKKDKREVAQPVYGYIRGSAEYKGSNSHPWKYDQWLGQSSSQQVMGDELLSEGLDDFDRTCHEMEEDYEGLSSPAKALRMHQMNRRAPRRADTWTNELRACATKLIELTNERVDFSLKIPQQISTAPDYSLAAAITCLNELEDIPQSSEMYLDAIEILKDAGERECFICLNREPRRRWLQRMLQRHYPARYTDETE